MPKLRKIIKTGNSLCLTIPSTTIKDFDLREGDLAICSVNRSHSSITYVFTGHPRQLSLIDKKASKS